MKKKKKKIKIPKQNPFSLEDLDNINQVSPSSEILPLRASETSYVFIQGHKVLIRNLTDEMLNDVYEQYYRECTEMSRQLNNNDHVKYNLSMEQRFRGLK